MKNIWARVREATATASAGALLREDEEPEIETCTDCKGSGLKEAETCVACEGSGVAGMKEVTSGPYWVYNDDPQWETLREASRTFSADVRKRYAAAGIALPDGSYPVPDKDALDRAVQSYGHNPTPAVKAHIVKRARALGATAALPEDWQSQSKSKESEDPNAHIQERLDVLEEQVGVFKQLKEAKPASMRTAFSSMSRVQTHGGQEGYKVVLIREGKGNLEDDQWYTAEAVQEMCESGICEGMQAYGDHPDLEEEELRPERSVKELVGTYHDVEFVKESGKARAEAIFVPLTLNEDHPRYGWVVTLAEAATRSTAPQPICGISLYGLSAGEDGTRSDGSYGRMVSMIRPSSGDIVTNAGAGGGFVRQLMESARALRNRPTKELPPMKALDYQTTVREAAKRVREADSDETREAALAELEKLDAEKIDETPDSVTALREAAPKLVSEIEESVKTEEGKTIEELQGQLREVRGQLGQFTDGIGVIEALREAGIEDPTELRHFAHEARKASLTDKDEIKSMVESEQKYEERKLEQLRESLGLTEDSEVEGVVTRIPAAATLPTDGGETALRESGLPIASVE